MVQPKRLGRTTGATSSDLVRGHDLALEAFGEACRRPGSDFTAFGYLWRRFGPPVYGADPHKDLVSYILTTREKGVYLLLRLAAGSLEYSVGYLISEAIENEYRQPQTEWAERWDAWFLEQNPGILEQDEETAGKLYWEWKMSDERLKEAYAAIGPFPRVRYDEDWRTAAPIKRQVNQALFDGLKELLRPIHIRDTEFNILGYVSQQGPRLGRPVKPSRFAGLGVPLAPMEALLKENAR